MHSNKVRQYLFNLKNTNSDKVCSSGIPENFVYLGASLNHANMEGKEVSQMSILFTT